MGYIDSKATPTPRTKLARLADGIGERDTVPWERPEGWDTAWRDLGGVVLAYMEGKPLTEVGARLFQRPATHFTPQRNDGARGLPPVFKVVGDVIERALSVEAGCFLALHECWLKAEHPETPVPEALQALPLCVRNGCDNLDVLAWFRFGFRQRMCAHALEMLPTTRLARPPCGRLAGSGSKNSRTLRWSSSIMRGSWFGRARRNALRIALVLGLSTRSSERAAAVRCAAAMALEPSFRVAVKANRSGVS
jgi:hypothetical protein